MKCIYRGALAGCHALGCPVHDPPPRRRRRARAAQAIADALAKMCFRTQLKQAEIVGESQATWSLYLSGTVRPGEAKIEEWVNRASKKTGSPIRLSFFEGEWSS